MIGSLADLVEWLQREGVACRAYPEMAMAEIVCEGEPIFVQWIPDTTLVQLFKPLPFLVAPSHQAAVERLIVEANHSLRMPGFGLDGERRSLYFRLVVPRQDDGTLTQKCITKLLTTISQTVRDFLPSFMALAGEAAA